MASFSIPEKIGKYQVKSELGRGTMGVVYLAWDPFIERMVAIKTALIPSSQDSENLANFRKIFFNEAHAAGRLMHRHIVSLYDATVQKDKCYLVMEYVDGVNLKKHCRKDSLLPMEKVIKIIFQCSKALDYAHQNEVIHRDIKPGNIMISKSDRIKISDFGIAVVGGSQGLSGKGSLAGSANYCSPEQLRGEELTRQTDIFSLGVVMYELLTGLKPFRAGSFEEIFHKITHEEPEAFEENLGHVPESLRRIVHRALEKDTRKRYKTGLQLASELKASFDHLKYADEEINFQEKFDALKKIEFFKDFSNSELAEVLRATHWVRYEQGSTIIEEGEIEDSFYVIVVGRVRVKKKGSVPGGVKQGGLFR